MRKMFFFRKTQETKALVRSRSR